jgi:hypothetical protein
MFSLKRLSNLVSKANALSPYSKNQRFSKFKFTMTNLKFTTLFQNLVHNEYIESYDLPNKF